MIEDPTAVTVECWSRNTTEPTVIAWQESVYERLREYANSDRIARLETNTWSKCIRCPTASDDRTETCANKCWETYCQFEDWATSTGYDLEPGFRRYERSSLASSESCEPVVVPVVSLAVYSEDELGAVFPCSTTDRVWTVEDGLAVIDPDHSVGWADIATEPVTGVSDTSEQEVRRDTSTS
ncbi:HTH domain-containing protein [Halovenus sp. HT40]|uniref:HTH domain-containing protein n=1 Tax=Halovenus sp. HT40 TaxID=3126691 RepID=UPI00300EE7DD